jgi:hypothetical protein
MGDLLCEDCRGSVHEQTVPLSSIRAGHSGHMARIRFSQPSSFSRNLRGRAYSMLPSWLTRPKSPNSGTRSFPRAVKLSVSRLPSQTIDFTMRWGIV